jgi:hypothetical protein
MILRTGICFALAFLASPMPAQESDAPPTDRAGAFERTIERLRKEGKETETQQREIDEIWSGQTTTSEAIAQTAALFHPELRDILQGEPKPAPTLFWDSLDPFLATHLALSQADRLIARQQLDAAVGYLDQVRAEEVIDKPRYLFLRASALYPIGREEEALAAIRELRQLEPIPRRYLTLVESMQQSIEQTDPESLDAVARQMWDVRRRLDLGEVGDQVRTIEQDVVRRLDLMIQKVEQKQESSSPTAQPSDPNAPADDSRLAGAQGEGRIDTRRLGDRRQWGNLPPKEREKTLQEIGRELPGPYRSAVEEYFRKLAQSPNGGSP